MSVTIDITPEHRKLLECEGNILVLGGPGSGKTTIALLKAKHELQPDRLKAGQRVLFLSFARATVARVAEQAGSLITRRDAKALETNTYHGFAWRLLRSHGYLLNADNPIRLLPPPEAAARLAGVSTEARQAEMRRLFEEEGLLHFDLFAPLSAELLSASRKLAEIVSDAYPIVILDEFQDTNADEWEMIQAFGTSSRLIALADAEQRIYEFRGADPRRIGEFIGTYSPTQFDFGTDNRRSNGTDIVSFGNDLLAGANRGKDYDDVTIKRYGYYFGRNTHFSLKASLIMAIRRQTRSGNTGWSIAVLVPTKRLMLSVSDYLSLTEDELPTLRHEVALDAEGPSLAAVLIAGLLEAVAEHEDVSKRMILDLCAHIRGRKGATGPNKLERRLTDALVRFLETGKVSGSRRQAIVDESRRISTVRQKLELTGDPWEDWLSVRTLLENSTAPEWRQVAEDAKYLRLLHKGALLRSRLGDIWRTDGNYAGAAEAVRDALLQEHFSASTRTWVGVHVMTIHKSKGKEFDEVLIYEGRHQGRIVRSNASDNEVAQARLALRVAVTRARERVTILTPGNDVCRFL